MSELESTQPEIQSSAALREEVLAELEAPDADDVSTPDSTDEPATEPEEVEAGTEEVVEDAEPEAELAAEPKTATPDEPDTKTDKAIERIHAAEKQSRTQIDSARAELVKEKAEWTEKITNFEARTAEIEAAEKRAKHDPAGLLESLGVKSPTELMNAAKLLHAMAVKDTDKANPEQLAQARRTLKDREVDDRVAKMEQENLKLRSEIESRQKAVEEETNIKAYTDRVASEISDKHPLVNNMLKRAPDSVRKQIFVLASELHSQTGEPPDAIDVIRLFEETERKSLTDRGIDPDLILEGMKRTKTKTPAAGEKRSASIGTSNGTTTKTSLDFDSEEELRADVLREIEA